jgi:hypothetical protein
MKAFDQLCRFFIRFRYPISLPEDIAEALGINLSNYITFEKFVSLLTCPSCKPTKLHKYMSREKAELAFKNAHCKEQFKGSSLYSFYFAEGWMEFMLEFDDQSRLRRMYLHHKNIELERGAEIQLYQHENAMANVSSNH